MHGLPGQQHPGPLEACFLLGYTDRLRGGIGGIAGSLVFRRQDSPHYRPGVYAGIACNILMLAIVVANTLYFRRCNKLADQGKKVIEGDPNFRYTI